MKALEISAIVLIVLVYFGILIFEFSQYLNLATQLSYKFSPFLL